MMRLFFSLYGSVALVIIGLAAALDNLFLEFEEPLTALEKATIIRLAEEANANPEETLLLPQDTGISVALVPWEQLQWPADMEQTLNLDKTLMTKDSVGNTQYYHKVNRQTLLEVTLKTPDRQIESQWLYSLSFYGLLALALVIWTWPLWKGLNALSKSAQSLEPDGSMLPVPEHRLSMTRDIATTFNRLAEQVQSLLAQQRETAGALAHELRTPLSRLQFSLASKPTPGSESWLAMGQDVAALESLVQEMLDYSRMQGLAEELVYAEIPLKTTVEEIISRVCSNANVDCNVTSEETVVLADGHLLERALQNLIQNACRHAKASVKVGFVRKQGHIQIRVDDDGPGVDRSDRERVFEPFFRPDQGRSRRQGGAGLGLAIVARIAEQHKGRCWVTDSTLGGACFVLCLPAEAESGLSRSA